MINQQQPQVDLTQTTGVKCECGNDTFSQSFLMRKISSILTGNGKPGYVPIPVFTCTKCGTIIPEMIPPELKMVDN
tara:strand:+ start:1356 stop:1583 length:228 start_codon:yes stop_codon:yes gene_type:complete